MPSEGKALVFEAHGDDMEFACGGTIGKFVARGRKLHGTAAPLLRR